MIVVDTSAIIAIFFKEEGADQFLSLLTGAPNVAISTVTLLECNTVVLGRYRQEGLDKLRDLFAEMNLRIRPFDELILSHAIKAFIQYGKGINSKAALNFGDCASYALAKYLD